MWHREFEKPREEIFHIRALQTLVSWRWSSNFWRKAGMMRSLTSPWWMQGNSLITWDKGGKLWSWDSMLRSGGKSLEHGRNWISWIKKEGWDRKLSKIYEIHKPYLSLLFFGVRIMSFEVTRNIFLRVIKCESRKRRTWKLRWCFHCSFMSLDGI